MCRLLDSRCVCLTFDTAGVRDAPRAPHAVAWLRRIVVRCDYELGHRCSAACHCVSLLLSRSPSRSTSHTRWARRWKSQREFETVFGGTLRVGVASIMAYLCGEFLNVILFQRLRDRTNGRHLWARLVFSTVVGAAVDSIIFYPLAFYGVWDTDLLLRVMVANYLAKVTFEVAALPFSYWIVAKLKREEGVDPAPSPCMSDREDTH